MKILDKFLIVLFNILLLLVAVWISAVPVAKNKKYYENQFEKNQIYSYVNENGLEVVRRFKYLDGTYGKTTYFTNEQLDLIIEHIIDYLFNGKDSFELHLDQVLVDGEYLDDVSIFGEVAVTHMKDVKVLFTAFRIISLISLVGMIAIFVYFLKRLKTIKKDLLNVTLIFYGSILLIAGIFLLIVYLHMKKDNIPITSDWFLDTLWRDIHHILFMFQPEKVEGSFFNDILTEVLTLDLFITAVIIVVVTIVVMLTLWLTFTIVARIYGDKIYDKSPFKKRVKTYDE